MTENNVTSIEFSLDLRRAALFELDFLKRVDESDVLKNPDVLRVAVYRYEKLWLPFLQNISRDQDTDTEFTPPLDIHWIWHVHMLSPIHYRRDCKNLFGKIFNHKLKYKQELDEMVAFTKRKWSRLYPEIEFDLPDEVDKILNLYPDINYGDDDDEKNNSKFSYDLHAAALRQQSFYYQVSLPHYRHFDFLKEAEDRYTKFIELNRAYPNNFLVPCYDIDLIWHTHQVHPFSYANDMKTILGFVLPHDDTDTDRKQDSKLSNSYDQTRKLWNDHFNENYPQPGVMYRGKPPSEKLQKPSDAFMDNLHLAKCKIYQLKSLEIAYIPTQILKEAITVSLQITKLQFRNGDVIRKEILCNQKIQIGPKPSKLILELNALNPVVLRNDESSCLEISIKETALKFGRYNVQTVKLQNSLMFNPHSKENIVFPVFLMENYKKIDKPIDGLLSLKYIYDKTFYGGEMSVLRIIPGSFKKNSDPDLDLLHCCGLPTIDEDQDHQIQTAIHKIHYQGGSEYLSVAIDHSLPLKMSVIRVYSEDKLLMLAHTIDSSTVGLLDHYKLSLAKGDQPYRAMILKESKGDVGLVFAHWFGMRKKILPSKGLKNGKSGHPGIFQFSYFDLKINREVFTSTLNGRNFNIKFKSGVVIDFSQGIIVIPNEKTTRGVFTTAMSFVISTLYLLVQPRPQVIPKINIVQESKRPAYYGNAASLLVNASGWQICNQIPTNVLVASETCCLVSKEETCTANEKISTQGEQITGNGSGCGGCGAACGGSSGGLELNIWGVNGPSELKLNVNGGSGAVFGGCSNYGGGNNARSSWESHNGISGFGSSNWVSTSGLSSGVPDCGSAYGPSSNGAACELSSNGPSIGYSSIASACASNNTGPSFGLGNTGSACGSNISGPSFGLISTGSACGSSSTGPACGFSSTGSACGSSSTGPACGFSSTGSACGASITGSACGSSITGLASGSTSTPTSF